MARAAAAAFLLCGVVVAHPICRDYSSPLVREDGQFCSGKTVSWKVNAGSCCDDAADAHVKSGYDRLSDEYRVGQLPNAEGCRQLLRGLLCTSCNPFAGHLFNATAEAEAAAVETAETDDDDYDGDDDSGMFESQDLTQSRPIVCPAFAANFTTLCGANLTAALGASVAMADVLEGMYCAPFDPQWYYNTPESGKALEPAFPKLRGLLPPALTGAYLVPVPRDDLYTADDAMGEDRRNLKREWWVTVQDGTVLAFDDDHGASEVRLVLNISDRVAYLGSGELGLLGLAFSPDFASYGPYDGSRGSGVFYLNYVAGEDVGGDDVILATHISRFTLAVVPAAADVDDEGDDAKAAAVKAAALTAASEELILAFAQPFANHNGGWMGFSPQDGYLYVSQGDGGSQFDPYGNAQNTSRLLGKILRLDVGTFDLSEGVGDEMTSAPTGSPTAAPTIAPTAAPTIAQTAAPGTEGQLYNIPADNPFGNEVWAYGLRNPWRCAFASHAPPPRSGGGGGSRLWCGEVGQDTLEEVELIQKGQNHGWNNWDGSVLLDPGTGDEMLPQTKSAYRYCHSADLAKAHKCSTSFIGHSITGGHVYRGGKYKKWLEGHFIFADYQSLLLGHVGRGVDGADADAYGGEALLVAGITASALAEGADHELLVVEHDFLVPSMIYRFKCGPLCGEDGEAGVGTWKDGRRLLLSGAATAGTADTAKLVGVAPGGGQQPVAAGAPAGGGVRGGSRRHVPGRQRPQRHQGREWWDEEEGENGGRS